MGATQAAYTGSELVRLRNEIATKVNGLAWPATVVFNSHVTALAVARSLGRRGIPIVALDRDNRGIAFYSRYTTVSGLCPNSLGDEQAFIDFLLDLGPAFDKKPILFPCMDEWVWAVAKHKEDLQRHYLIPLPDHKIIDQLLGKKNLYKNAERLGIPIPETYYPDERDVEEIAKLVDYPCILKPEYKREFYEAHHSSVMMVGTPDELVRTARELENFGVMVQAIIPTSRGSLYTYGSYIDLRGEALGEFVGRRLEVFPIGFGTTCLVESKYVEEVRGNGFKSLKQSGYHGISEVEFIYDERDGQYKLLDINTRPWKWIGLPIAAGVDMPWLAYSDVTGKPEKSPSQIEGITWVYLYDYARLKKVRKELGESFEPTKTNILSLLSEFGNSAVAGDYSEHDEDPFNFILQNTNFWEGERAYYCPC